MPDSMGGGTSRGMRPTDLEGELAAARARTAELEAELAIVNEVGQALARQLDFQSIMEAVGERAAEAVGAAGLSIAMLEPETGTVRFLYWLDHGVRHREMEGRVLGDVLTARILATGRPIRVGTADEAAAIGAPFKVSDTESYLGVPIPASDRAIGVIAIGTDQKHAYSEDDERLLSTLATNMGVALANARLFEETKRLLAETRRQKQYFEALVEISPAAVVTMDRSETVSGWNPAATRLFGYEPDEAIGRHVDDLLFTPEERAEGRQTTRLAEEAGRAQLISRRRRKDGELVDVEIVMVPLVVDGEHTGYYAIYHDITELQAARREADAANEAKSTFLASMSHEIRTPMNAIIGMSGLMLDTPLDAEQRDFAETIQISADALLTIINDILDFSKIEAGRIDLEAIPFALGPCIEGVIDVVAPSAAAKHLELAYTIDPNLPHALVGDAGRLRQIVLNLLSNAVKFTETGEVVVSVSGRPVDPWGRKPVAGAPWEVSVAVRDTGSGIPPNRMDRLFQSFSQADASISRRYGGTGLGLAISKRLAELQGGSITADSTGVPGEGSRFVVRIVAPEAPPDAVPVPRPRPPERRNAEAALVVDNKPPAAQETTIASAALLGDRHPLRILLAEDQAANQKLALRLLQRMGYAADLAGNGLEAIAALEAATYDLVLMDVHMPDCDGLEATRRIRARWPGTARPRIVAMTASAMAGDREACLAAGMDDYISKPIRLDDLTAALEGTASRGAVADSPVPDTLDRVALAKLLELVGSDPDFVDQLVDEYLADAPRQAAAVRAAFDAGDPAGLVQPAHKLKGTSLNLGGMRVADVARSIEERGRVGTLDGVEALLADLLGAGAELVDELERARARRWASR